MSEPWEDYGGGQTATATEEGPWTDFAPAAEPSKPDFSKIKPDASQMLIDPATGMKRESGMESGTELTAALPEMTSAALSAPGRALVALGDIPTRISNIGKNPEGPGYTPTLAERGQIVTLPRSEGKGVAAGVQNLLAGTAESFIGDPANAFTMALIPGEGSIAKAAALAFGSQMLAGLPKQVQSAIATINDPNSSTADKVEAVGQPAVNALLSGLMLKHGLKKEKALFQGPLATGDVLQRPEGAKPTAPDAPAAVAPTPVEPVPEPAPVPPSAPEATRAVETPAATAVSSPTPPVESAPAPETVGNVDKATAKAKVKADADEFRKLVQEYGVQHRWIKESDLDFLAPELAGKRSQLSHAAAAKVANDQVVGPAYLKALAALGIKADKNSYKLHAEALPKLKEFLAKADEADDPGNHPEGVSTDFLPPEPKGPKLAAGVKQGDLVDSTQRDTLSLAGEVTGDAARIKAEAEAKAKAATEAKALADKQQQDLFTQKPTPAAPAQKMEGPGSPSVAQGPDVGGGFQDQSGRDIYGIAARVRAQRAKAGQVAPVESGEGVSPKESVEWGRELLANGVDPEAALNAFEKDPAKKIAFDLTAVTRAHGEALAKAAVDIESKFGTDTTAYRTAKKALDDWDARTKKMDTQWHKIGQAMQGHTDIDTGSFTGIQRAYHEATGKDLNPRQEKTAKKIAKDVSEADKKAEAAKAPLQPAIDKIGAPVEPHIRRLADKIIAAMDKQADAALQRIRARQAQGKMFSGGIDPEELQDLAIYGAAKITKGIVEFGAWSAEMVRDIGEGIRPHLQKVFDAARKHEDEQTSKLAGGPAAREKVRSATKGVKAPESLEDQRKVFAEHQEGKPLTPQQQKILWQRAKVYIDKGVDDKAEIVHKVAQDLGISAKDALRGMAQTKQVKRVADDVWQKHRQARILKQSAKRWIETANETWIQKAIPNAARLAFTLKTGFHGTVAIGTHAPLEAAVHPVITAQNFGKMYKLVASPEYYEMQQHELASQPNYTTAHRAGLVNDMSKMEDFNDPKLALGFPKMTEWFRQQLSRVGLGRLQGMGTRGYSVLKILRQDLFDHEWNKLPDSMKFEADGKTLHPDGQELAKAIADSVNHMTGVVKAKVPSAANYALFAPKLELSRLSVIAGDPARAVNSMLRLRNMTPSEKWFATNQFKEKAKIFSVASGLLLANQQLNNLFGDKKKLNGIPTALGGGGWNPMESDFMKFRVAGMNVAWGSPFLTMMRLPLRIYQIGKGDGGKTKFLIYPDESMYKTVGSYLRTQVSPFLAPIVDVITKADYADRPLPQIPGYGPPPPVPKRLKAQGVKPYTWKEYASEVVLPIPFEEGAKEIFHARNTPGPSESWVKPFVTIVGMAATGARISEDWKNPGQK